MTSSLFIDPESVNWDDSGGLSVPAAPALTVCSSLDDLFDEVPVALDTFVADKKFLASPPLSPVQFEAVQFIERIWLPELYTLIKEQGDAEWEYWKATVRMVNLISLEWGKGSGKDHICRVASLRVAYLLLCLKNPQRYYDLPSQDTISLLNVASSSAQAERAFFRPMTRVVKHGWFSDKSQPKQQSIEYAKNIEAVSGHSDAEGQEGLNLILGVADEIDAFRTKDEASRFRQGQPRESPKSAEAILDMLHTSASTRFPESYKRVAISYPRFLGSTIQRLTAEGKKDIEENGADSNYYVSGPFPTWDVNPRYDRFDRVTILQSDTPIPNVKSIIADFERDPVMARAKYQCLPERAIDGYFRNMEAFRSSVTSPSQPLDVGYELREFLSEETGRSVTSWDPKLTFRDFGEYALVPMTGALYAMHCDLAITGDRAGIAMAHVARWEEREVIATDDEGGQFEQIQRLPIVILDFVISFEASTAVKPTREIQIRWARMLVFELIRRGFQISMVSYDGFQSFDSMQQLALHGIPTDRRSTDLKEEYWKTLRDVAYEGRLEMPFSQLLLDELGALGRIRGKVDHPSSGSKDLADAVAVSVSSAVELGGSEDGERRYPSPPEFVLAHSLESVSMDMPASLLPVGFAGRSLSFGGQPRW